MNQLDTHYLHCLCEIKNQENELIAAGNIQEIGESHLVISTRNSKIPGLEENIEVKVNIYNFSRGFCMAAGTLKEILMDTVTVGNIDGVSKCERRQSFRVEVSEKAEIMRKKGCRSVWTEVLLRDLSLGGCLIETREPLGDIGDTFELSLKLLRNAQVRMNCRICRQEKAGDVWRTGNAFTACPSGIEDKLCAYIFEQQRRQLHRKENSSPSL